MSSPSIDALTAGKRFSASTDAAVKNDIMPSLTPWVFSKASLYRARVSIIGSRLTSLNVVNMAAVFCACFNRSAIFARKRLIGTRRSFRPANVAAGAAGAAAGALSGADAGSSRR